MARRAKIYKTNKQKKKKVTIATASSPQVLRIQTAEEGERKRRMNFNHQFFQEEREDLLDRL